MMRCQRRRSIERQETGCNVFGSLSLLKYIIITNPELVKNDINIEDKPTVDDFHDIDCESSADSDSDSCIDCDQILDELPEELLPIWSPNYVHKRLQSEYIHKQINADSNHNRVASKQSANNKQHTEDNIAYSDPMLCNDPNWWISKSYYDSDDDPMDLEFDRNFVYLGVVI